MARREAGVWTGAEIADALAGALGKGDAALFDSIDAKAEKIAKLLAGASPHEQGAVLLIACGYYFAGWRAEERRNAHAIWSAKVIEFAETLGPILWEGRDEKV